VPEPDPAARRQARLDEALAQLGTDDEAASTTPAPAEPTAPPAADQPTDEDGAGKQDG